MNDLIPRSRLEAVEKELQEAEARLLKVQKNAKDHIESIERDALVMALRLMGEKESTFSPECYEVMTRWRKIAMIILSQKG
jgi:hypothetical protein